jgi:hypothetical protein
MEENWGNQVSSVRESVQKRISDNLIREGWKRVVRKPSFREDSRAEAEESTLLNTVAR